MSVVSLLLLAILSLVVVIPLLGGIGAGTYLIFRHRVPRGGLIALVIGIPLVVVFVIILIVGLIVLLMAAGGIDKPA